MNARRLVLLLAALALVQIAAPVWLAWRYESTLRHGRLFRIKVEPIDPADAFRGRFVMLRLMLPEGPLPEVKQEEVWQRTGWAVLDAGSDGFARLASFSWTRPAVADAVPATLQYVAEPANAVDTNLPSAPRPPHIRAVLRVERYYMNEDRAPEAERTVGRRAQVPMRQLGTVARVRVRNGVAAIEGLDVDGLPIETWLASEVR